MKSISVIPGDGIGPEIMDATLTVLRASGIDLKIRSVSITPETVESSLPLLLETEALLKAPLTTPQGGGFKSLTVSLRGALGLFANIRPSCSYAPFVQTKHPKLDLVVIRENEEDLYCGLEWVSSPGVSTALKIISDEGSLRIIRFAFEYALAQGRKKVSCFTKDNILKLTDGRFRRMFERVAEEYPSLEHEHLIIDIGSAKLAETPERFDVIVLPNLYGDILSDVAAELSGSVGLAASSNIGYHYAFFEAVHGSAPKLAGKNQANPSGLLLASLHMLAYLGECDSALLIHNAWLKTLEEGIHTKDLYREGLSRQLVGTKELAQAVVARLGKKPEQLSSHSFQKSIRPEALPKRSLPRGPVIGCDLFIHSPEPVEKWIGVLQNAPKPFSLERVTNRGLSVWPTPRPLASCIDEWCLRFVSTTSVSQAALTDLLTWLTTHSFTMIRLETLTKESL